MKKILLVLIALCALQAQAQIRPYLTAGSVNVSLNDDYDNLDAGSAFRIGAGCYIPALTNNFYIVPELSYSSFKYNNSGWIPQTRQFRYSQLHLPVIADYRLLLNEWLTVDLGAGPFVSYGFGKAVSEDGFRRLNAGLTLRARAQISMFAVGISYDWGLVDMQDDIGKTSLSMLGITFGIAL